jgi:Uncharacterised nucleotidyltransferase
VSPGSARRAHRAAEPTLARGFSPEQQFIAACVRSVFGQQTAVPAWPPIDWRAVVAQAVQQGLAPLVHTGLPAIAPGAPDGTRAELRAAYLGAAVRTEAWVGPTLERAIEALRGTGLEPIVLKGAALAYQAYPEPAQRTLSDIDLLLPPEQVDRASAVLLECGFWTDDSDPHPDHHLRPHYGDEGLVGVELHHALLPEPNPYTIDLERIRARTLIKQLGRVEARVLAAPDALLFTCIHLAYAHRYRWFPLRSLTDILAMATRCDAELDWGLFVTTVRSSRTAGAVYWPLRFSSEWLRAPVPDGVLSALGPPTTLRRLVEVIAQPRCILDTRPPPDTGSGNLYRLLLDLSLYSGESTVGQVAAYLGSSSRVIRALARYLGRPRQVARILGALWRLVAQRSR